MTPIPPFALHEFFFSKEARAARHNLSPSFAEPLGVADLFAFEPETEARLATLSLAYPDPGGSEALRLAVAGTYETLDASAITAFHGTDETISAVFHALVERGDVVVTQFPVYQSLYEIPRMLGAKLRFWPAEEERSWAADLDALPALLEGAKLLVLNQPQSPTGYLMSRAEQMRLMDLAADAGVVVVADEIYRGSELDPAARLPGMAELSEQAVSIAGLSKTMGLPGLRVGWAATRNEDLRWRLSSLADYLGSYVARPSEVLGTVALRHHETIWTRNRDIANDNLAHYREFFQRHGDRFHWHPPRFAGAVFPRLLGTEGAQAFSSRMAAEQGILIAPSSAFGFGDGHLRMGLGTRDIPDVLGRLASALSDGR